jgi:hypothetical protein
MMHVFLPSFTSCHKNKQLAGSSAAQSVVLISCTSSSSSSSIAQRLENNGNKVNITYWQNISQLQPGIYCFVQLILQDLTLHYLELIGFSVDKTARLPHFLLLCSSTGLCCQCAKQKLVNSHASRKVSN